MKLSIITINFNNAVGITKSIKSVINQTNKNYEFIIIDGASSDESIEIIKNHSDFFTYWVSEPDRGIYNAMNKGIYHASGDYCLFLNSGDCLVDEDVVSDFCEKDFTEDIVAGSISDTLGIDNQNIPPSPNKLTYDFFVHDSLSHPATFIKRELFDKVGLYNEKYKIVSDWEFFLKALILYNCSYTVFKRVISNFDHKGISRQTSFRELQNNERELVLKGFLPRVYPIYRELEHLRIVKQEYDFLKAGHLGFIVRFLLMIKALKKRYASYRV